MLEAYFVKPQTVDRVLESWISPQIEQYVIALTEQGYGPSTIHRRVPLLVAFAEFARLCGAQCIDDLSAYADAFVEAQVARHRRAHPRAGTRSGYAKEVRGPIEHMLAVVVPGFTGRGRPHLREPFCETMPGFFGYLVSERGLRPATVNGYRHHLRRFEDYLRRIGVERLEDLSPALLSAFMAERSGVGLSKSTVGQGCAMLRVFLRYAFREGRTARDLSGAVGSPQAYRLSSIPRSIPWADVTRVLARVDRRTPSGKRDYAILLLLVTYGLRSREIAALTLDHIDWKHDRLAVPERKAGHSTAFPLATAVGEALIDYLQHGRPKTSDRHVFFRAQAPLRPIGNAAVSGCARRYLLKAGIDVPRPGSHTLRHTAVQRLVDTGFSLKTIGDFVGHRSAASTEVYAKVAVEPLRQVALGHGEEVLQ